MRTDPSQDGRSSIGPEELAARLAGGSSPGAPATFAIFVDDGGGRSSRALSRLAGALAETHRARIVLGTAVAALHRPYGPFPEIVEAVAIGLGSHGPEVVARYGRTVRSLALRPVLALLEGITPFEAQLAGYALRGDQHGLRDYYVGRNVRPRVLDDLVRFLLDAAGPGPGEPLVLCIDRLEEADAGTVEILDHLRRYAGLRSLAVVASWSCPEGEREEAVQSFKKGGWEFLPSAGVGEDPSLDVVDLSPAVRASLEAAAVFPGRFDLPAFAKVAVLPLEEARAAIERLASSGLVLEWGGLGFTVPPSLATTILGELSAEERRILHVRAAGVAPALFERVYHLHRAGAGGYGKAGLAALEAAWGLSAYDAAAQQAEIAFSDPEVANPHIKNLLLGLLDYEARRFSSAHEHLLAALEGEPDEVRRATLQRLIGYNGVFGLRRFDVGQDYLRRAKSYHEAKGNKRDAAWISNTMAFGLMQSGQTDEAIALERTTLEAAGQLPYPDRFLLSILHLNLGRLYRRDSVDEAVEYIRRSMADGRGESGPYMLLLLYITLGNLYFSGNRPKAAAAYFARCVDLAFDIDLSGFSDRTFPLLAKVLTDVAGPTNAAAGLRGDVARLLCHFNFAVSCRRAGRADLAEPYRRWVSREAARWGSPELAAGVDSGLADRGADSGGEGSPALGGDGGEARSALTRHLDCLTFRDAPEGADEIAGRIAAGAVVAFFSSEGGEFPLRVCSYVLFDPRSAPSRARAHEEFGRQVEAGGVLALPQASPLFEYSDPEIPAVSQEVTLRKDLRTSFPAVLPIRTRLRFIEEGWSELRAVAVAFARQTSVPFLSALSLRRAGEEIADTPTLAVKYFLETSIDLLLLDRFVVEKSLGVKAPANLFSLRPQFSGFAAMPSGVGHDEPSIVMARHSRLRIGSQGTAVLSRCDGQATVGDLVHFAAETGVEPTQVCDFLLDLRRRGVIHFAQG